MWTYKQLTGELYDSTMKRIATGYSGAGDGKNNPAMQEVRNIGPLPKGIYSIGAPRDLQGGPHGPFVLPLTPNPKNEMFGRAGFLIHGDNSTHTASEGCIILPLPIRMAISQSPDKALEVIA
jgi:hypothetical protein